MPRTKRTYGAGVAFSYRQDVSAAVARFGLEKILPYALMFHTANDVVAPHSVQRTFDLYGSRENSSSGGT